MKNLKSYREYLEYVYTNEFSIGNMLPQVPLNEKSNTEKPNKVIKNDKGQIVPTVCPKCGSKVKVFFKGEPVYLCSNEKCKRFFGVVPLDKINESVSSVYGAYDAHGKWNAAVDVDGRTYRYRVECLVINGDKVFVSLDKHGNLIIPGGSAEKDIDDTTQVANECREEARINIKNPIYTGIDRIQDCPPHISKHKSVLPFEYDGSLSKVYVAEYDSDYNGYIDEYDKDEKMIRGKFVPLKDVINRLKPEWREALNKYTNVYYRVTYNGEGIYNALKNNIPLNVWMDLLKSDAMRWLPKPPKYNESSRSYFTKEGFKMFMRKTYPVMRKYLNLEFVNIEEVRLPNKMMYSDKYQVVTESSETKYDPPYTYDEIVKNYGKDMADKLVADPAHKFRCHTGIELIHKEPSLSELNRIHSNWQLMTDEQKRKSDMKSRELFGCDNETNYTRLVKTYNEACKDVKTARKFVSEVGKLAKKYDANYFIVTDGASGVHNNGNPAVKNARDSQVEWEKKHGFDPDEDWSKTNINESFETFLTTNPFENTIHLYHASHNQEKLKTINPLSKNFGSRISSMRLSSFWAVDKNVAIIMAIVKLIGMCGYKVQWISGSRFAILNHSESEYDDIMDSLKDKVIWLYEKTMPKKYVKIGHDNVMEEYSIDIPVSPDKSTLYTFNDYKKFVTKDKIVFLTADFLQSKGKTWYNKFINNEMKIIKKENGRFLGNALFKNHDTKAMMNKDFKLLNSNVNESVFMNKDDYYFDFDKFESGESNILFVTGLTGSGKSTIGRSFASKYHAEYVELDLMDPCSNLCSQSLDEIKKDKSNKVIYEYLSSHKSVYERLKSGKMRNDEIFLNNVKFISFVRSYANKHKDTKFIVEGLQLYEYCTFRKTIIKPMVIKGTSVLTSFIRKVKREKWPTKDIIKYAPGTVKRMIKDDKVLLQLINACKTDDVINESVKRSELPDDVFGIPQERKYPMQDKQHVKAAIKFFNYVEPKYEEQLANRIIENMKIYNIDASSIGDKNRLKKYIIEGSRYDMTHSLVKDLEFLYFESGDPDIPDLIEPIVKQLESKGYQVKYASPGHTNTRFDNDQNKDGVINAKMRSTARIIFSRDYRFKTTPQGWEWKVLENGSKALYVKPYTYNEKMGSKEEAFKKWQTFYIDNMKSWVTDLPKAGSDAKSKPDVNF